MINDKAARAISMLSIITTETCSPSKREKAIISSRKSLEQIFLGPHKVQECLTKDIPWLKKIGKNHLINTIRLMIK
jgi:hypothetical protein